MKDELHISAFQLGVLFAAFFWTYSTAQIFSGWIIDRYDVNWVLAAGFVLWSLATTATGLIHGFAMLIAVRMLLGAAESVAFPSYGKIIALHVPHQHRGIAIDVKNKNVMVSDKTLNAVLTFNVPEAFQ